MVRGMTVKFDLMNRKIMDTIGIHLFSSLMIWYVFILQLCLNSPWHIINNTQNQGGDLNMRNINDVRAHLGYQSRPSSCCRRRGLPHNSLRPEIQSKQRTCLNSARLHLAAKTRHSTQSWQRAPSGDSPRCQTLDTTTLLAASTAAKRWRCWGQSQAYVSGFGECVMVWNFSMQ